MKPIMIGAATLLAGGALAAATLAPAAADSHEPPPPIPPHAHLLVLDAEVDFSGEEPVLLDYRRCIDLAANRQLPLGSQHEHVHFGTAGEALEAGGGHLVVPTAPAFGLPWTNCATFLEIFGF
ncbi:hypothetical protein [Aquipuribacter nitratireducens]|uniref:Uncharacterized protein n=1 Tax=Aquipuribacter nitratireducens TaxID=650104 RepID=A0ABW0GRS6_9MICO